jgi:hypothetical protein
MSIKMPVGGKFFGDIIDRVEIGQMLETSQGRFRQHLVHFLGLATRHVTNANLQIYKYANICKYADDGNISPTPCPHPWVGYSA